MLLKCFVFILLLSTVQSASRKKRFVGLLSGLLGMDPYAPMGMGMGYGGHPMMGMGMNPMMGGMGYGNPMMMGGGGMNFAYTCGSSCSHLRIACRFICVGNPMHQRCAVCMGPSWDMCKYCFGGGMGGMFG